MAVFYKKEFPSACMHLYIKVGDNPRWVVFTQQETIYSRAHLVFTNLLITSLVVLSFPQYIYLYILKIPKSGHPPKNTFLKISLLQNELAILQK